MNERHFLGVVPDSQKQFFGLSFKEYNYFACQCCAEKELLAYCDERGMCCAFRVSVNTGVSRKLIFNNPK